MVPKSSSKEAVSSPFLSIHKAYFIGIAIYIKNSYNCIVIAVRASVMEKEK